MTQKEIWKEIPQSIYRLGIQPYYEASNYGRIRNKKTGKILTPTLANGDWNRPKIQLRSAYYGLSFQVSHIIYTTFIGDCYGKVVKRHDGNPLNNTVDNLYI